MIPFKQRGMYQAMQNILFGFGAVLGASLGGAIVDTIGWRWCFLLQVPVSLLALVVGYFVLENPDHTVMDLHPKHRVRSALKHLDLSGAFLLVVGLVAQTLGLSLGGNEYDWSSMVVFLTLVASFLFLAGFVFVEAKTRAMPMIPLRMLKGCQPITVQVTNVFVGMCSYAVSAPTNQPGHAVAILIFLQYMFMVPLYFQAVRGDSPSAAGMRLMIPALATPVGGVIAGSMMQRGFRLCQNVRLGTSLMLLGNLLTCTLGTTGDRWKELVYLVPANLGLGLTNPSVLFSFVSSFEHRGMPTIQHPLDEDLPFLEQAVATSTVYLIRSMGTIYGVTVTSAIVQNVLIARLPETLGPDATEEVRRVLTSEEA